MVKKKKVHIELPPVPEGVVLDSTIDVELYRENMLFREVQHLAKLVHLDGHVELTEKLTAMIKKSEDYIQNKHAL